MASVLFSNLSTNHSRVRFIYTTKYSPNKKSSQILIRTANSAKTLQERKLVTTLPEFPFKEYRAVKKKQVYKALDESIPLNQHPTNLAEAMRYTLLAEGNAIASTLCIASCEAVGGDESVVMPLACALEMIVAMAMIQDDLPCLDNDDVRRGKLTNHKVFGEGASIMACQALLCLAMEKIASDSNVSSDVRVRTIKEITDAMGFRGVAAGQLLDCQSEGKEVSLSELEVIHRHKTGKFVEATVVCGALLGGGSEFEIEKLRSYGKFLGLAAQVCDDVIDVTGSTEKMGKKVGRDALRDKATSVKFRGLEESKKYAREMVAQAYQELSYFDSDNAAPLYHIANLILSKMP